MCYVQQVNQRLQEIGSYCSLFIVLYMTIRYIKLTVSLMRAMILERLSFQEAFRKYVRPDQQIYRSLVALYRALDLEGTSLCQLGQNARP